MLQIYKIFPIFIENNKEVCPYYIKNRHNRQQITLYYFQIMMSLAHFLQSDDNGDFNLNGNGNGTGTIYSTPPRLRHASPLRGGERLALRGI